MLSASPSSTNVCDLQRSLVIIYGVDHGELDHGSDTPVCIQLARILRDQIKSGELHQRRRIPSENDLVQTYGIARDTARKAVRTLSGGEKSRVQLALLMLAQPNLLLLDEPTNNLDVVSSEVLEDAIEDYAGTVLAISHDRYFLERVAGRVVELRDGRLVEYPGGYAEYRGTRPD